MNSEVYNRVIELAEELDLFFFKKISELQNPTSRFRELLTVFLSILEWNGTEHIQKFSHLESIHQ